MMKLRLVANRPAAGRKKELVIGEKAWRPARSLMAIATQRASIGTVVTTMERMGDIDENVGFGIDNPDECQRIAKEMRKLIADPFAICDYGMTTDIDQGVTAYTYPTGMCTAYFEDADNGDFYETLNSDGIVGKRVRSWFRTTETQMLEVISFLEGCGGFLMP